MKAFLLKKPEQHVSLEDVRRVAEGAPVTIDEAIYEMLDRRRAAIVSKVQKEKMPAYGFNRGFGHNVDQKVPSGRAGELQRNLIRSHACGVGEPVSVEVVRATMFLRLCSLARGHSGVRAQVVRSLVALLNARITPVVPALGSVGASGDLAPLSHIALGLLGEGQVFVGRSRKPVSAAAALEKAGIAPLVLEMKEGLALNNGVQFSNAIGILSALKMYGMLKQAAVVSAISAQVMLGSDTPFRADLHALRPHPGARKVAGWIWDLMRQSPLHEAHAPYGIDGEVQDPYNLRCAAQVLGGCYDLVADACKSFEIEANSVTDNPLLLAEDADGDSITDIVSGGHFHGMPVAIKLYHLMQAMGIMSRLSNMRCVRYVDEARNKGLGRDLKWPDLSPGENATSSGMMMAEYASASLTNYIWGACTPTHLYSLSTDAGQEDHVSMSTGLAVRLMETLPRMAEVLAIELAFATQAASIRQKKTHIPSKITLTPAQRKSTESARRAYKSAIREELGGGEFDVRLGVRLEYKLTPAQRKLSPACQALVEAAAEVFPPVIEDRDMHDQIAQLATHIMEGRFLKILSRHIDLAD